MGTPKLTLPVAGTTVIGRVIAALQQARVTDIAIVTRRNDELLHAEIRRHGVTAILPEVDPPDMRVSIEQGLNWIEQVHQPAPEDAWLLLPADHPIIDAKLLGLILNAWQAASTDVLIPVCNGRRGHPLIARWKTVTAVRQLPPDVGVNRWLRDPATTVTGFALNDPRILCDLDHPEDYARLLASFTK